MLGVGTPSFGGPQGGAGTSGGSPSSAGTAPADSRPSSTTEVRPRPDFPPMRSKTIEVPLPLVVACARDGVTIHPGGYRLSPNALKKQGALSRDLEAIVRNHAIIDPSIRPKPRIEFLIEPGGTETYAEARKQTVLSGYSWPVSVQVSETSAPRVFSKERF